MNTNPTNPALLQPLVAKLRACPTHHTTVNRERCLEAWEYLKRETSSQLRQPTVPVMAALILDDDRFAQLLSAPERTQLQHLIAVALERYEQQTNPTNRVGKLLAGLIKET